MTKLLSIWKFLMLLILFLYFCKRGLAIRGEVHSIWNFEGNLTFLNPSLVKQVQFFPFLYIYKTKPSKANMKLNNNKEVSVDLRSTALKVCTKNFIFWHRIPYDLRFRIFWKYHSVNFEIFWITLVFSDKNWSLLTSK